MCRLLDLGRWEKVASVPFVATLTGISPLRASASAPGPDSVDTVSGCSLFILV